jgi:hypothetical protein
MEFFTGRKSNLTKNKNHSSLHASFNTIRVGQSYRLVNYGEVYAFEAIEIIDDDDCLVRSLDTLETFHLNDLVRYGKGADFDFGEL